MAVWQFGRARRATGKPKKPQLGASLARRSAVLNIEPLEERLLFSIAPTLVSIITNIPTDGAVLSPTSTTTLNQAPQQITLKFDDGQIIDPTTLNAGIQIVRSGGDGVFGNGNDQTVQIGYVGVPQQSNQVVVRFQNTLADDTYRVVVTSALKNTSGQGLSTGTSTTAFKLDYGAQVSAVVPQPVTRNAQGVLQQAANQIVVYFANDTLQLPNAQNPALYQLIKTQGTANTNDDTTFNPTSVVYDAVKNTATLTFASNLDTLGGTGLYRLRIGDNATNGGTSLVTVNTDAGSSFGTSTPLGTLGTQTQLITGAAIDPPGTSATNAPYPLTLPGATTDPGARDLPVDIDQNHLFSNTPDSTPGISTRFYNFQSVYGSDPLGNPLINQITDQQKADVRAIFALYGKYLGVQFVETANQGLIVATGDPRAVGDSIPVENLGGIFGGTSAGVAAVMNNFQDWGTSPYGGAYFETAMHEIGHYLGLNHSFELPGNQAMGSAGPAPNTNADEPVLPGDFDILDGQYLFRPEGKDIDIYNFTVNTAGTFSAETIAQRLSTSSLLNTVLSLYDASGNLIARNDDYFGADSFVNLELQPGQYRIAVSSTGNINFNPNVVDSGYGGTTEGSYNLRLNFSPIPPGTQLLDLGNQPLDGDLDGKAGGNFNFWFQVGNASNTRFVDKIAPTAGADGSLAHPYNNIQTALYGDSANGISAAPPGTIVRIVGNGGADGNVATLADDKAYEIGTDSTFGTPLSDGATMNVPKGVTVMIDAGAIFKLRGANINTGTFAQGLDLSQGALQVLGTPQQKAYFTSYNNETVGFDTNPLPTTPAPLDWGGLVFQNDSDYEAAGIFVNYLAFADISYGGGPVVVDAQQQVYNPIHLTTSRPTILNNNIHNNADAAISADPNSFEFSRFEGNTVNNLFTADYSRSGPLVHGNTLANNSTNGLFIRIRTNAGSSVDSLDVTARLTSTDIVYVLNESLFIQGQPGGAVTDSNGVVKQRVSVAGGVGGLIVDPGVIVKSNGSRIEVGVGAQLIAEGTSAKPIIFTSLLDDSYGAGGVFDTTGDGKTSSPAAGDWSGFYFSPVSTGSIDHAVISYAGGISPIEGGFAHFNAVEIYQATVRIVDSILERNADGADVSNRNGRASTGAATIYVIGAQPVILNNIIRNNIGDAINVNANSLNTINVPDWGRNTGRINRYTQFDDNYGPLVRLNVLDSNTTNGMEVRGATLTTQSLWDDVDIVHVLQSNINIPNFQSTGGLELKSSATQSLVVKLAGETAGFTADGKPLDITNRIGGSLVILGSPGHPVVLTSLGDNSVGAGVDLAGNPQVNTVGVGPTLDLQFKFAANVPADARVALQQAAAAWSALIHTPVTVTIDVSFAHLGNFVVGDTQSTLASLDYDSVRARMIANQTSSTAYLNQLPTFAQLQATLPDDTYTLSSTMQVTRAEALALGYNAAQLPKVLSSVDNTTPVDAKMRFNLDFPFDYTRADGITTGTQDFVYTVMHEIGHALGFDSAVDDVVAGIKQVQLTPLDLFRMAPGQGAAGFNTAPRLIQSGAAGSQVFFDGGVFNNPALMVPGSTAGDVPLSTGSDFQASHWLYRGDLNSAVPIGIMDPIVFNGGNIQQTDIRAMQLIGWDTSSNSAPGSWNGITLTQYANDRNVALVNELEKSYTGSNGDTNGLSTKAQSLGTLAPDQLNGDENRRLGFEIHGAISYDNGADQDVYSFQGTAGSQVWFDIAKTSPSLDTVLELVDANGTVLARSDNSLAESNNPSLLAGLQPAGSTLVVHPLELGDFSAGANPNGTNPNLYSTNLKDAGMRLILPGAAGNLNTYYIRVRSNGGTSGQYQMQIRLQEQAEVPGSTIQFSDIRNAKNAIVVQGLPDASPLTGTSTQVYNLNLAAQGYIANNTFDTAQDLGNLLTSDQNMISVSSVLLSAAQVQWFKFTLDYQGLESIQGANGSGKSWSTIFDVDYAGGVARPDLTLSVFDSLGNLVYISRNGNATDDRPTPTSTSQSNLGTGSSSPLDPFLGNVQLPEGASKTYYVAISSDAALPTNLVQTFLPALGSPEALANPTLPTALNTLIRLEPVNSVVRIVEDHLDPTVPADQLDTPLGKIPLNPDGGYTTSGATVVAPSTLSILPITEKAITNPNTNYPGTVINQLSGNIVSYTLGDVPLFVSANPGNAAISTLYNVNATTGATNATIGGLTIGGVTNTVTTTLTMRSDGILYGDQPVITNPGNGGKLVAIDPTNAQSYIVGPDNIVAPTFPLPIETPFPNNQVLTSFRAIGAIAFQDIGLRTRVLNSNHNDHYIGYYAVNDTQGITHLFRINPSDGNAVGGDDSFWNPVDGNDLGTYGGNDGSLYMDENNVNSNGPYLFSSDVGTVTGMAFVTRPGKLLEFTAASGIISGQTFSISDISHAVNFQFILPGGVPTAGNVPVVLTGNEDEDGVAAKVQDAIASLNGTSQQLFVQVATAANNSALFSGAMVIVGAFGASAGTAPVGIIDFSDLNGSFLGGSALGNIGDTLYGVTSNGQFITIDYTGAAAFQSGHGIVTSIKDFGSTRQWAGLALAPQNVDVNGDGFGGDLTGVLFAITTNGDLYAIDSLTQSIITSVPGKNGGPAFNLFPNGSDHVSTGLHNVTGLGFSQIDFNLWHPTTLGAVDPGHGINPAPDHSRDLNENTVPATDIAAVPGAASYYFGFENYRPDSPAKDPFHYIPYHQLTFYGLGFQNSQYGMQFQGPQQVLSAYSDGELGTPTGETNLPPVLAANPTLAQNSIMGNNYNAAGGAKGALITNSFSLAGYSATDLPTLYFNYLLDAGWDQAKQSGQDAAQVSVSTDNGATWHVVASNQKADQPRYTSVFANTGSQNSQQGTQFLFNAPLDDDGNMIATWRQARVDLSGYYSNGQFVSVAGQNNVKLKFNFVAGGGDNDHHGFAIDDIVIGLADRGEMVTLPPVTDALPGFPIDTTFFPTPQNPVAGAPAQVLTGPYQLTIRRGETYGVALSGTNPKIDIDSAAQTVGNSRSSEGYTLVAPGARALELSFQDLPQDGQSFTISDGVNSRTFEFDWVPIDLTTFTFSPNGTTTGGRIGIPGNFSLLDLNAALKYINTAILQTINGQSGANFRVTASFDASGSRLFLTPTTTAGNNIISVNTANAQAISYDQQIFDGDTFLLSDGVYSRTFEFDNNGSWNSANVRVVFSINDSPKAIAAAILKAINGATSSTFGVSASIQLWTGQGTQTTTSNQIDLFGAQVVSAGPLAAQKFTNRGDSNLYRAQGQVIIANNTIRNAANYGISVLPAVRDANNAQQQSAANLVQVNNSINQVSTPLGTYGLGIAPGVVIQNNVIDSSGTGGILFTGDSNVDANGNPLPNAIVPFGRILNNTIYGAGSGIGINVGKNASPTLLNNILASLQLGIGVDATSQSTVLGANLFQANLLDTLGTAVGPFAIVQAANAPLFVNAAQHNFNLLKTNSSGLINKAIDSSLQVLQDRTNMTTIDSAIGINPSQILAPTVDNTGKLRVDDPQVSPPIPGLGSNVYIDRGAIDRSDFVGPTAALANPVDNNSSDQDPALNSVLYGVGTLANFQVQLSDGNGSGVDDSSVSASSFTLTRDGVPLVFGTDYSFSYDSTNKIARFTPFVGIWAANHVYTIKVDNSPLTGIKDLAANSLVANNLSGTTLFTISLQQLDFGSAPSPYPTTLVQNGARHILSDGLFLGTSVAPQSDGIPSSTADNGQPGSGVVFTTPLVPGKQASITVVASQAGKLDAWIDFNGNGTWGDAGDQIFASQAVVAGTNTLSFNVPITATTSTYARFRLSSAGGLSSTGLAQNGEVEDYQVTIQPSVSYSVILANPTTGIELPKDDNGNYVLLAGGTFQAQVYVTDTRSIGSTGGVQGAYADLVRDLNFVNWVAGSLKVDPGFPNATSGAINGNIVDEAGGVRSNVPTGSGTAKLLFSVNGTVTQAAAPGTSITIATAAATGNGHSTTVFGSGNGVAATYGSTHLVVPTRPWQNPGNHRFDVNNDGFINILDIVRLVGEKNAGFGGVSGALPTVPSLPNFPAPPPYVDVNGDSFFNILDIIAEVSYINAHGSGPVPADAKTISLALSSPLPSLASSAADAGLPAGGTVVADSSSAAITAASSASDEEIVTAPASSAFVPLNSEAVASSSTSISSSTWGTSGVVQASASSTTAAETNAGQPASVSDSASDSIRSQLFADYSADESALDVEDDHPLVAYGPWQSAEDAVQNRRSNRFVTA